MKRSFRVSALLLASLFLVVACGGEGGTTAAPATPTGGEATGAQDGDAEESADEMNFEGRELNIVTWGGVWTESTEEYFTKPFSEETGVKVNFIVSGTDPTATVLLQAQQGNVQIDLADTATSARLELDGYLEHFPDDLLSVLEETSREGTVFPYTWELGSTATLIVCNPNIVDTCPTNAAEFWDVENFPGRRAFAASYSSAMTFALLADGLSCDDVWPMDVERSIASLREIKPHITVWPDSGSMQEQVMVDEEVGIAFMWNGRAHVVKRDHIPELEFYWDDSTVSSGGGYAVPKGAPNADVAFAFIKWLAQHPEQQAKWTEALTYPTPTTQLLDIIDEEIAAALPAAHDPCTIEGLPLAEQTDEMQAAWQAFLTE